MHGRTILSQYREVGDRMRMPLLPKLDDIAPGVEGRDPNEAVEMEYAQYRLCVINNREGDKVLFWIPDEVPEHRLFHHLLETALRL